MYPTQLNVEDTGHNPDVLLAALVHNREKDKFLVAKRRGTLGKGAYSRFLSLLGCRPLGTPLSHGDRQVRHARRQARVRRNVPRLRRARGEARDGPGGKGKVCRERDGGRLGRNGMGEALHHDLCAVRSERRPRPDRGKKRDHVGVIILCVEAPRRWTLTAW